MANIIDPKYEYDAPVYVDFTTLAHNEAAEDDADKWFGKIEGTFSWRLVRGITFPFLCPLPDNRLEDDLLFDNSFNPVGIAPQKTLPTQESHCMSVKTEPTSVFSVHAQDDEKAQSVPVQTEPAVPVCTYSGDGSPSVVATMPVDLSSETEVEEDNVEKGSTKGSTIVQEVLKEFDMAKVKAPKPKKAKRLDNFTCISRLCSIFGLFLHIITSRIRGENVRQGRAIARDVEPEFFSVRSVAFQYVYHCGLIS